jgi:hypothetical protein
MKKKKDGLKFKFNGKSYVIADYTLCKSLFSKIIGIMFKKNPKPLLFIFDKPTNISIHSFFCRKKFIAIWLLKNRVIDARIVMPWKLNIVPREKFDKLLELPFNDTTEIIKFSSLLERFKY